MLPLRVILATLAVATWYDVTAVPDSAGPYCGSYGAPPRWVAVDAALMHYGILECGQVLEVEFVDYDTTIRVVVWDIGPLESYGHYIEDYAGLPYMLDLDSRAWPVALDGLLSARVRIKVAVLTKTKRR